VQAAAQQVATALERHILARPECWYQFYRYWDSNAHVASGDGR